MKLKKFYSLRNDFVIIGITGRIGSGCTKFAKSINDPNFIHRTDYKKPEILNKAEDIKFDHCYQFLSYKDNFAPYLIVNYKNVLLLHLIFDTYDNDTDLWINNIIDTICQFGDGFDNYINRFGKQDDAIFLEDLKDFFVQNKDILTFCIPKNSPTLKNWLTEISPSDFKNYFFGRFENFSNEFYEKLNEYNLTKRSRLNHDLAINLKTTGVSSHKLKNITTDFEHIYTIAETINRIIKLIRKANNGKIKIVIDSLKNSLELMYFKEKYSSFYMVAINTEESERERYVLNTVVNKYGEHAEIHGKELIELDKYEYKGDEFNDGKFTSPDIENCIQKSDYHIYHTTDSDINDTNEKHLNINYQIIKLLALISQPGIITPTPIERTMQVAFNAKYNSGCISRQVGAVICDENHSIKAIGWNDVAENQMPCKLRNADDFKGEYNLNPSLYSDYELNGGEFKTQSGNLKFSELLQQDLTKSNLENLEGRNCSFCFKSFQNKYEGEKNQVHTRSLHAEENAMLQISKYGGVGIKGGYLFTTASPCELCSKKAFQIGVKKLFSLILTLVLRECIL